MNINEQKKKKKKKTLTHKSLTKSLKQYFDKREFTTLLGNVVNLVIAATCMSSCQKSEVTNINSIQVKYEAK